MVGEARRIQNSKPPLESKHKLSKGGRFFAPEPERLNDFVPDGRRLAEVVFFGEV